MSTKSNQNCCLGCKNGYPGQNHNCKVHLLKEAEERKALSQEELAEKYA